MGSDRAEIFSQEQLDEARRYADTLVPGSYEQERVKLSIALCELTNEVFAPLGWAAHYVLDFILIMQVAGWLAAFRATWRALVVLGVHILDGRE